MQLFFIFSISSLPTNNETLHRCPPQHHRDPENLNRSRRNIFTKVTASITKATKYVGKKLHIIKRDVSPVLNHNETDLNLENQTNKTIIRVTRSETQTDHNATITNLVGFENVTDSNSTVVVEPQRVTREVKEIQKNETKVLNVTTDNEEPNNRNNVTELPEKQANITFFIQFFNKKDTQDLRDIKAESPITHHHHHSNVTKRETNEDEAGGKKKRCCSRKSREAVRGASVNDTHVEMKRQEKSTYGKYYTVWHSSDQ